MTILYIEDQIHPAVCHLMDIFILPIHAGWLEYRDICRSENKYLEIVRACFLPVFLATNSVISITYNGL